jgi:hypothetical protein
MRSLVRAYRYPLLLIAAVLFVLFWGLPTLVTPFAADQNWFSLGARTILDGDQLYRDFQDQKTPLINLLYTVPFIIFGERYEAVRVFDLANVVLAMGGVFLLTRRFFPERAAVISAAIYAFVYLTSTGSDGLAETESFIVAPLTIGLAIYPVRNQRYVWYLCAASGALLGLAFGFKFSVAPLVLALPAMELLFRDSATWRPIDALKRLTIAGIFFVLVQLAWIAYLALAGVLDAFIEIQREYTLPYQDLHWAPGDWSFPRFVLIASEDWLSKVWYLTAPALSGLMLALLRGPKSAGYFFGLLVVAAFVTVWWQGKFFQYHWILAMPFMAPLAGFAVHEAIEAMRGLTKPAIAVAVAAVVFAFPLMISDPLITTYDGYHYLADRLRGNLTQAAIDALYSPELALNHEVVAHVTKNSEPEEPFYVFGVWPQVIFWADRASSTNFVTNAMVRADFVPEEWKDELVADLEAKPPRFIAITDGDWQPWLTGTERTSREDFCDYFPRFRAFVEADYQPVLNNGLFILYDREATEATTTGAC